MSKTDRVHINNLDFDLESNLSLTSIINGRQTTPRSMSSTILDYFSRRVRTVKQLALQTEGEAESKVEISFNSYLEQVSVGLNQFKRKLSRGSQGRSKERLGEQDLTKCYNSIPYVYFERGFVLNLQNYGSKQKMKQQQEVLNQFLDLIEINLISQVTCKFVDFHQALVNFQELELNVQHNIARLKSLRSMVPPIKTRFLQKALNVSRIIQLRSNKEAILKHITVMKSLRRLPPTIKQILQSPLPHESLALLTTGKSMYQIVRRVRCLDSIGQMLQNSSTVIKHSLEKSFIDKMFLYLTSPLDPPYESKFQNVFSVVSNNPNNSLLQELVVVQLAPKPQVDPTTTHKTQEQLVATIIEGYQTVDFVANSRLRSKLMQHIKIITKQYFASLKTYLSASMVSGVLVLDTGRVVQTQSLPELMDKIDIGCLSRILSEYQDMFRVSISRLLSILNLLYCRLSEQHIANCDKTNLIVQEFSYVLTSIIKIVCDQTLQYLSTKKLSKDTTIYQFQTYLNPLSVWIDFICNTLSSTIPTKVSQNYSQCIIQYQHRLACLNDPLIHTRAKLQDAFIANLHMGVIKTELKEELQKQSWMPVEDIPYSNLLMLTYIFNRDEGKTANISINEQLTGDSRRQRGRAMGYLLVVKDFQERTKSYDIKLLKNGVVLDRKRYKITGSLLLFMEVLEEYLKIQQIFTDKKSQMIVRIGQIATFFSTYSTQLIVWAGALRFPVIKTKNINVKHLCLLWGTLRLLCQMIRAQDFEELAQIVSQISSNVSETVKKMSAIICTKVQAELSSLYKQGLSESCPTGPTQSIVSSQRQMMQIMEEYLDQQAVREVMSKSVTIVLKNYFGHLSEKGQRGKEEGRWYLEQMRVLELSFQKEVQVMKKIVS